MRVRKVCVLQLRDHLSVGVNTVEPESRWKIKKTLFTVFQKSFQEEMIQHRPDGTVGQSGVWLEVQSRIKVKRSDQNQMRGPSEAHGLRMITRSFSTPPTCDSNGFPVEQTEYVLVLGSFLNLDQHLLVLLDVKCSFLWRITFHCTVVL